MSTAEKTETKPDNRAVVTRMVITYGKSRRRYDPRERDRRVTKAYGEQIRMPLRTDDGGYIYTGGRQKYRWVSLEQATKEGWRRPVKAI